MIDLPQHAHTNRELESMLAGSKPLARFGDDISFLPNELLIPEEAFSPHVASGLFLRAEKEIEGSYSAKLGRNTMIRHVLFCVPDQAWRIPAMFLLMEQFNRTGKWNETLERIEGSLLGYTEEENDIWCADRFKD